MLLRELKYMGLGLLGSLGTDIWAWCYTTALVISMSHVIAPKGSCLQSTRISDLEFSCDYHKWTAVSFKVGWNLIWWLIHSLTLSTSENRTYLRVVVSFWNGVEQYHWYFHMLWAEISVLTLFSAFGYQPWTDPNKYDFQGKSTQPFMNISFITLF